MAARGFPRIDSSGFFVLRTPLLPFSALTEWAEGVAAPTAQDADLDDALARDRSLLRTRLIALVRLPEVREAIFLASPSLAENLDRWCEQPDDDVERAVVRYVARMAGRPTPFALLAGCSVGTAGAKTRLAIDGRESYRRHARLSVEYLAALTEAVGRDEAWRSNARYRPNPAMYVAGGSLRHVVERSTGFYLVATDPTPYLRRVVARAAEGMTLAALADCLSDAAVPRADIESYLRGLVEAQVLVSELRPPATSSDPAQDVMDQLSSSPGTAGVAEKLDAVHRALRAANAAPLGASPSVYRAISSVLEGLPATVGASRQLQVDLVKPASDLTLSPEVEHEIVRGVEILAAMAAPRADDDLIRFRAAFEDRHGDREVPLLEALDEEVGIGFGTTSSLDASPLLDGLAFEARGGPAAQATWSPGHALLLRKLEDAWRGDMQEIVLEPHELSQFAGDRPRRLADSLGALAVVAARSTESLANGDFLVWLRAVGGPSGASLLGRFCHGDARMNELVVRHLDRESAMRPDAVLAEIAHLPSRRDANVLVRPVLRAYEIACLGRSGAPPDRQIALDDLVLTARDGRIVLRSRRLGKEVVPRLCSAHEILDPRNPHVYRFLGALQYQDRDPCAFSWGVLESAAFLPRVRAGRVVLSLARWRLDRDELRTLAQPRASQSYRFVQRLRRARRLPRWIAVTEDDTALPIDLDNALSVEVFARLVARRSESVVTEIFEPERLCAHGPEGRFVHELVLPLLVRGVVKADGPSARVRSVDPAFRVQPPGSEWLVAKVYTGKTVADRLLRGSIAGLVAAALASGAAKSWSFVRYEDPEWHLRLRFRGEPRRLHHELLPMLEAELALAITRGLVRTFQLDTYVREVERYGGPDGIAIVEDLFCADSEACLEIIGLCKGDAGADARWRLAARGMDLLLEDLGFDLAAKLEIVRACVAAGPSPQRQVGPRFRRERADLEVLMAGAVIANPRVAEGVLALRRRSTRIEPLGVKLRRLETEGGLDRPVASMAPSIVHMHANRVFASDARTHEVVLYDLLTRLYAGRWARRAGAKGGPTS